MSNRVLICIVAFLLASSNSIYGKIVFQNVPNEKIKISIDSINELAWKNRKIYSVGKAHAIEARRLSDSIFYDEGLSTSLTRLGVIEKIKGNYNDAINHYLGSLKIEEQKQNLYGISRAKIQIGRIYHKIRKYDKAIEYSNQALDVAVKDINNEKHKALIYYTIGSIYFDTKSFEKSLEYYYESSKIRENIRDTVGLARDYLDIGNIYNEFKKYNLALSYFDKGESLYRKIYDKKGLSKILNGIGTNYFKRRKVDSSLIFYNKSLIIKEQLGIPKSAAVLNNIGVAYIEKKQLNLATEYFNMSVEIAEENGMILQLIDSYYNLGRLYRKQKKYKEALDFLDKSLELTNKNKEKFTRLQVLITLAETYENLGDFRQASLYNEKHIVLRDSIDSKYRDLEVIEKKYEEQKKNNEINKEKNLRVLAESNRKTIKLYALTGGVVLMALLFFALFYAYKSKKAKESAEQNQKIEVQKNIELLKKQELKSIKAMINGQESERKRIAQDLHDRLGSMLSMVKLNYKSIEDNIGKLKEENRKQYSQANDLLDEACNTVREIAHNMVSGVLTKFGLVAALEDLKNTIKGTNTFQLELITHGLDDRLENSLEMELYGIVQELIHNVIKHANAKEVSVQLLKRVDSINLTVIDDGVGFENSSELPESGMGLKSVASRVNELNGAFDIDTGRGSGTTINIDIPL